MSRLASIGVACLCAAYATLAQGKSGSAVGSGKEIEAAQSVVSVSRDDLGRLGTSKDCDDNCRIFYVNYVVLTQEYATDGATLHDEADTHVAWLNEKFRTRKGYQLYEFRLKGYSTLAATLLNAACPKLHELGDADHFMENEELFEALGECRDTSTSFARELFATDAINVYVYDAHDGEDDGDWTGRGGRASGTSYGFASGEKWPYVFLDYVRFSSTSTYANYAAAQEHEMGHAFGLGHLCVENATSSTATPIMATPNSYTNSAGESVDCPYSTGDRSLGFAKSAASYDADSESEIDMIRETAEDHESLLGSPSPGSDAQW